MDDMKPSSARYYVLHETDYQYGGAVSLSHQMLHLSPRECPWQTVYQHQCAIGPQPDWSREGADAFGNPVLWLGFDTPHEGLHVRSQMDVEVLAQPVRELSNSLSCEALRARLSYRGLPPLPGDLQAKRYLFESSFVRIKQDFCDFSEDCFASGKTVLEATHALMQKIFEEFTFDPQATTISTPVLEVLAKKRGVCQDYAHLMLACLRSQGIPARYMSGYLLTQPPPGKPRLIGADASHAWVAVYAPDEAGEFADEAAWVAFDPTNNLLPSTEHITLSWGRDFNDVSPMRGIILGGGVHEPTVEVTVMPRAEASSELLLPL